MLELVARAVPGGLKGELGWSQGIILVSMAYYLVHISFNGLLSMAYYL
jgi:hypothetical protein